MRIGVVAQQHEDIFGIHQDYLSLVEEFGTPVPIFPVAKEDFWNVYGIDGLLLPGGADINPKRYGAWFSFMSYRPNPFLEIFDTEILPEIVNARLPIFGICRGLQTLNVHFGGTLHQHLRHHPHSATKQHLVHEVTITYIDGDPWKTSVNSSHHQAINTLAPGLFSLAKSYDGLVEAIAHKDLPIRAVQWHPERIFDKFSLGLMHELFT
jgi:putative glutamine amidotransferase